MNGRNKITLLTTLILLAACEQDTQITTIDIEWRVGLERPEKQVCDRAGIERVHVWLASSNDEFEKQAECSKGGVQFKEVPKVDYELYVSGLNEQGCPIYSAYERVESKMIDGSPVELHLQSVPAPGHIEIGWWFEDARFCQQHEIDKVRIIIFNNDTEIFNDEVICNEGSFVFGDAPAGRYSIIVTAKQGQQELCIESHELILEPCGEIKVEGAFTDCWEN